MFTIKFNNYAHVDNHNSKGYRGIEKGPYPQLADRKSGQETGGRIYHPRGRNKAVIKPIT